MPSPRTPHDLEPDDGSGAQPRHDQVPAEPSRANPVKRIQMLTGGIHRQTPGAVDGAGMAGLEHPRQQHQPVGAGTRDCPLSPAAPRAGVVTNAVSDARRR